jgi:pyruvate dehydrogenase E1 component
MIRHWVPRRYTVLGTDGFGRSDTRAALRSFFEVDRHHVTVAALKGLADDGRLGREVVGQAIQRYAIDTGCPNPWDR